MQAGTGRVHALARVSLFHGANRSELLGVIAEGIGAILCVVDFLHQAGMGDGDVVALEIVVDVNLPIAIDDVVAALGKLQAFKLKTTRLLRNLTEIRGQGLGLQIEVHEDKLFPGFAAKRHHSHGAAVEEFNAFNVRSADQTAIESVSPAVILATQNVLAAAAKRDRTGTMAANVAESTQFPLLVANDDDGFTCDIGGEITFGVGDGAFYAVNFSAGLAESSDELPSALEDASFLDFKNRGIGVKAGGERLRTLDLFVNIEMERFRQHD